MDALIINTPHPGHFIREELEARDWNQRDLAFVLGVTEQTVNNIVLGKTGITPEMAKAMAAAFDVSADLFMNLQTAYAKSNAPEPEPGIARRGRISSVYPLREMIKRGWIINANNAELIEASLCEFFGKNDITDVPHLDHAAKKTGYGEITPIQFAWLYRVKQLAEYLPTPEYSAKALREVIPELHNLLSEPEEIRKIPEILRNSGVRFVLVEALLGSKLDGVCLWLDKKTPVIGMSTRFDRIDNFWFVLRHELEHVLRRDGQGLPAIDDGLEGERASDSGNLSQQERTANNAAFEFLVPRKQLNNFIARVRPLYSERRIVSFANSLGIHPGIVLGLLQHAGEVHPRNLHKLKPKIRSFITASALFDGWGDFPTLGRN